MVIATRPQARFFLVGEGPLGPGLQAQAARLGLGDRFVFVGFRRDVAQTISAFDLSVFPSLWEGTPITAFEALAMGKPIVATDADGLLDILAEDRDALIVPRRNAAALVALVVALAAAMSVDVVRAGYGVKGDEATYVAMALSMAYDRDLTYERRDLERFYGLYQTGPEGVFLKRGKRIRFNLDSSPPFLHLSKLPDDRGDRLYFGKSFAYSVAAAPFVRLLGMNG